MIDTLFAATISLAPALEYQLPPPPPPIITEYEFSAPTQLIYERNSGTVLYQHGANNERAMASLTKMLTALEARREYQLDEYIVVPPSAPQTEGGKLWLLPFDELLMSDLLRATLIQSANDAAVTLAGGNDRTRFVDRMNATLHEIGLSHTTVMNAHGLDADGHQSTALDMAQVANILLQDPVLEQIVNESSAQMVARSGEEYTVYTTNQLLDSALEVYGVKTGTTDAAGECLLLRLKRGEYDYLVVIMGSTNRYGDARQLIHAIDTSLGRTFSPPALADDQTTDEAI